MYKYLEVERMATKPSSRSTSSRQIAIPGVDDLRPSFLRGLLAQNKSPKTLKTYLETLDLFQRFLVEQGMPLEVSHIRRVHAESFITDLLARWKPATANNRYRGLQQFFKWAVEEGEIKESPMARMKPPKIPENLPPLRSEEELRRLVRACEGTGFADRRDMALVRLFLDCGARRAEIADLKVQDIEFEQNVPLVVGKGARPRACPFGKKLPKPWTGTCGPVPNAGTRRRPRYGWATVGQ
jgi:site-specific recombinase XerD